MSLPPGFLEEVRARVPLSRVVGRRVTWDLRRSNQAKGDFWAPCPFHEERTASFHVDDRKGVYYCFGCQAKGDAIGFLRAAEGMEFHEAVAALAAEAGLPLPARDPEAAARAARRTTLAEVMEEAVRFYRLRLATGEGGAARDYLDRRGMAPPLRDRFELGHAPAGGRALVEALAARGIALDLAVEAGLARRPDDGRPPYDQFRGRLMFPIRDGRGRAIGFGARALAPGQEPKYLNSPETPLFEKGRTLYNLGPARAAAAKGAAVILAEGYMDVIALAGAGHEGALAPLGTAVTADQLALLWEVAAEPVVALDGDAAGLRAARRLVDLALPLVAPGQGLRFALLPPGMDPDDLIRSGGPAAFRPLLEAAEPMVALVWQRETEGQVFDSPERRAALVRRLAALVAQVRDPELRRHYEAALRERREALFRPVRPAAPGPRARPPRGGAAAFAGPGQPPPPPAPETLRSSLVAAPEGAGERRREAVILATLALHPALLVRFAEAIEALAPAEPDHRLLHLALLRPEAASSPLPPAAAAALARLRARADLRIAPTVGRPGDAGLAAACLEEEFGKIAADRGQAAEIAHAEEDLRGLADEGTTWRLSEAARARERSRRAPLGPAAGEDADRATLAARLAALSAGPALPED
ncbi:MAG: DNA primase [Rhodobacteraceae bacterium]|nr:DNA primase [Paracoccaceae bacterium]